MALFHPPCPASDLWVRLLLVFDEVSSLWGCWLGEGWGESIATVDSSCDGCRLRKCRSAAILTVVTISDSSYRGSPWPRLGQRRRGHHAALGTIIVSFIRFQKGMLEEVATRPSSFSVSSPIAVIKYADQNNSGGKGFLALSSRLWDSGDRNRILRQLAISTVKSRETMKAYLYSIPI